MGVDDQSDIESERCIENSENKRKKMQNAVLFNIYWINRLED